MADDFTSLIPDLLAQSADNSTGDAAPTPANPLLSAQMQQESGGQDYDKNGNVLTSPKGAKGAMQVLDNTNLDPGYGVTPAQDNSVEERDRVGRDYSAALIKHYGDTATGLAAYNWGPGNVDKWLKSGADPTALPTETKTYIKNIMANSGGNQGTQYASADTGTQTDASPDMSVAPKDPDQMSEPELDAYLSAHGQGAPKDPDQMSESELDAYLTAHNTGLPGMGGAEKVQPAAAPQNPTAGLIANGDTSDEKTQNATNDIIDDMNAGKISKAGAALEIYNQAMKREVAPIGAAISSAIPQSVKDIAGQGANLFANTYDPGGALRGAVSGGAQQVAKNYPVTTGEAGALAGILGDVGQVAGLGKAAEIPIDAATDAASSLPGALGRMADSEASGRIPSPQLSSIPTGEDLRVNAGNTYKTLPAGNNIAIDADGTNKFVDKIAALAPQTEAGRLIAGDSPLTKLVQRFTGTIDPETGEVTGGLRNKPLTLADSQEIDEALGDHIDSEIDSITGKPSKQGVKLMQVQDAFRQAVDEGGTQGGDQLKLARAQWAQAARMSDLDRITNRALTMDNPATAIRTGMRTLANNPARFNGFSTQEKALIIKASKSGIVPDALKTLGSKLNPIVALASGHPGGALALQGLSKVGQSGATAWQLGRANAAKRAIAGRAMPSIRPVAEAAEAGVAKPMLQLPPPAIVPPPPSAYEAAATDAQKEQLWSGRQAALAAQEKAEKAAAEKMAASEMTKSQLADSIKAAKEQAEAKGEPLPAMAQAMKDAGFKKGGIVTPKFTHRQWTGYLQSGGKKAGHTLKDKNSPAAQKKAYETTSKAHSAALKKSLGRDATVREVELAHYVTPQGVVRVLKQKNGTMPAHKMFPADVVKDMRKLFFNKNKPYSVDAIKKVLG